MRNLLENILSVGLALAALILLAMRPGFGFKPSSDAASNEKPAAASDAADPSSPTEQTQEAAAPSSLTTASTAQAPAPSTDAETGPLPGVDISHYQGQVDWTALAQGGVRFVFAKATDGITYTDPTWAANQTAAQAAGLAFGGYHFYEPKDDPQAQAENFLAALGNNAGRLPPVVDLEKAPAQGAEDSYLSDVETFLAAVKQATGCTPIVYASPSFYSQYLSDGLSAYPLWLAEYSSTPKPPAGRDWTFWQHTQNGTAPGISGSVDLDWYSGDAVGLAALTC